MVEYLHNLSNFMKISLTKLKKEHFSLFYKWWNDKELIGLTSGKFKKRTKEDIDNKIYKYLKTKNHHGFIIKVDNKLVGHVVIHKKPRKKYFQIYIAIGEKSYWGKGVGTKAIQKICKWFFRKYPSEKVVTVQAMVNNVRAINCYKKAGFTKVRTISHKDGMKTILMKFER